MNTTELLRYASAFAGSIPMAVVPRRMRFGVTCRAARILAPVVGPLLLRRYGNVLGSTTDETARILFRALARMRVPFDVTFTSDMDGDVLQTLRHEGAVFVTAHFPMNALFRRWLFDHGQDPVTIRINDRGAPVIWGTAQRFQVLPSGRTALVQMRRALLERRTVLIAIERPQPGVRSVAFESRFGTISIATPVFTLAEKMRVPLFFFGVRATADGSAITVRRLPYDPQAFIDEFRRHTEQMLLP